MPRCRRLVLPHIPLHVVQRGHNRQACFTSPDDCAYYLHWLQRHALRHACAVHAYVLMSNHVHLLMTPKQADGPAEMMKAQNERYVRFINQKYGRSGSLWEGRFHSSVVQDDDYLLACQRYVELNPVRAGIVEHPRDYRWSSYRASAEGADDSLVTRHPVLDALASTHMTSREIYRELCKQALDSDQLERIRHAGAGNRALAK